MKQTHAPSTMGLIQNVQKPLLRDKYPKDFVASGPIYVAMFDITYSYFTFLLSIESLNTK